MFVLQALLEQQLAVEKGKMETEKKKFQHAMEEKVSLVLYELEFNCSTAELQGSLGWYVANCSHQHYRKRPVF